MSSVVNLRHKSKTPGSRAPIAALLLTLTAGALSAPAEQTRFEGYPIAQEVFTTRERSIVIDPVPAGSAKLRVFENAKFTEQGYGNWHYGPGIPAVKRLDLMPSGYAASSVTPEAALLNFFAVTDIHINDKETPAAAVYFGWIGRFLGGYSPTSLLSTQVLDATLQTINALHKKTPLDFGISIGDSLNNNQYNEARWYIDVMDGKVIRPSSGSHRGEDSIDYQRPYQAAGLDKSIPWYQAVGNHDHFFMGSGANSERIRQAHVGRDILEMGNLFTDPRGSDSLGFYMGSIDGATPHGDIVGVGPVAGFATPPKVAAADPDRRSLSKKEWMSEFLRSTTHPTGHGFTQANVDKDFACYSFEPKSGLPLKVIVLDNTQRDDAPNVGGYGHSSLDKERYDWLVSELDRGQAEGKLMVIAAHMPIGVELPGSYGGWSVNSALTEEALIAKLHQYPNLLLWIAGHRHVNTITAFKSPDPARAELGFWQVETSSLKDFPQQFRTLELVRNSDNTISILATNVDPAVKEGSLAARSRSYAVAAQQIFKHATASHNAELVKQLSPAMQARIRSYGTPQRAFDLQAHRGGRGLRPENTLASFENAIRMGVTTLELDIAITADGVPVISHDPALNPDITRDAQGQWLQGRGPLIKSLTLAQLQTYDVGRINPASRYAREYPDQQARDGQRVPTLASLFKRVKDMGAKEIHFDMETKINPTQPDATLAPEAFVKTMLAVIREAGMTQRVMVQSFDWRTLELLHQLEPGLRTMYLSIAIEGHAVYNTLKDGSWNAGHLLKDHGGSVPRMVKASAGQAAGVIWAPYEKNLSAELVKETQALGLKVIPWTVNEKLPMQRYIEWGVDGIITDYPDRLREVMLQKGLPLPLGVNQ